MRFADAVIDLAAVLNASRSVASRHVALRGKQLHAKNRAWNGAPVTKAETVPFQAKSTNSVDYQAESVVVSSSQQAKERTLAVETDRNEPLVEKPTLPASRPKLEDPRANKSIPDLFSRGLSEATKEKIENQRKELNVSDDVDINIFYTRRGGQILDTLTKKQDPAAQTRPAPPKEPAKEHPLRYWPNAAPPQPNTISAAQSNETHAPKGDVPSKTVPEAEQEVSRGVEASPRLQDTEERDAQDLIDNARAAAQNTEEAAPEYLLRESKVPASRLGRLWNYGGLAAGMLGGAMTEGIGRAFGSGGPGSVMLRGKNMERMGTKLSRMRGAALKLGQQLSFQDSKMLPAPIQEVLQRVQDRADYMPSWQRDRVLVSNLGTEWRDLFSEFEEKPIAAASIGQVHKAVLKSNGRPVAVKIQFPGVADSINSDLDNLGVLLTATKLLPKGLYLNKTIENARTELAWECDYEREAECGRRFKRLLADEQAVFVVPDVYSEASGKQVLTMDFMEGIGVTRITSFTQAQRDWIGTQILRLCLREITEFKFMQTDPNWTNFLFNSKIEKLELLDFGASRDYPEQFVVQYVQLLEAASRSDRVGVKTLSESLGYLTGHESKTMLNAHIDSVLTLAEPFLASAPEVYDFKDQTITERVKALIPVMLRERLSPPPEETYSLHRKLSGAFLLCAKLGSKVPCRDMFQKSIEKSGHLRQGVRPALHVP